MHPTAYSNCTQFFKKYCQNSNKDTLVVDVGSYDVNGNLKPIFESCKYLGLDMDSGPNVDLVCNGNDLLLKDGCADIVVSSSCFEHDICFWETFLEMCRIVKANGFIYINAPTATPYHAYPVDCWRFYLDSWPALEKYAIRKGYNIKLIEHYIDNTPQCEHKNSVGIFKKLPVT
jgi:hypothetical protein